jgi:hypothetical protein
VESFSSHWEMTGSGMVTFDFLLLLLLLLLSR